ncbi:MAG: SRPBCC domain-containing protein [Saprospiraceae bacterium]
MAISCTISDIFPTSPEALYTAWLDSDSHSAMTGGDAIVSADLGASFSAWDGYISGKNIELEPGKRILQSWRTTEFDSKDADSMLEILLEPLPEGTKLTLTHQGIPEGQPDYAQGWEDYYFKPMREYFSPHKIGGH